MTKQLPVTFAVLVERARVRVRGAQPESYAKIAERIGITRQHLYHLMNGTRGASDDTMHQCAHVFRCPPRVVRRALDLTQVIGR